MKILIVEDDKVLALLHTKIIEKLNMTVVGSAIAGKEAIEKVKELSPDLILMDVILDDDVDGIDAMLHLRKENITTPVIFVTGNSDVYNITRASKTNFIDYLIKPISFDVLRESIAKVSN